MLRQTMLGDIPAKRPKAPETEEPESVAIRDEHPIATTVKRGPYRKKNKAAENSYSSTFLVNDGGLIRRTTHVDREVLEKLKRLIAIAAPDVTLTSYLSNIVRYHIEQFQDEIADLYNSSIENPF